jgi:hypothetical protein
MSARFMVMMTLALLMGGLAGASGIAARCGLLPH